MWKILLVKSLSKILGFLMPFIAGLFGFLFVELLAYIVGVLCYNSTNIEKWPPGDRETVFGFMGGIAIICGFVCAVALIVKKKENK